MKFMLDTDTLIYAKNADPETVLRRFSSYEPGDLCISAITLAELKYGIENSSNPDRNRIALYLFLSEIRVLPFDANAAYEYGKIRSSLKQKGLLIGGNDMLIAAHARSLDLTLITNNVMKFSRVEGLKLENWV